MNKKYNYEIGKIYGTRKIIDLYHDDKNGLVAVTECVDCGRIAETRARDLMHDRTNSCICHLRTSCIDDDPRLYKIWNGMKYRCNAPTAQCYHNYGGRGIKVCEAWNKDGGYVNFKNWAYSHGYDSNLTIDRIDPDGDYAPENCQWITKSANTARANASRRTQHRKADNGDYYAIDESGEMVVFQNANKFGREHGINPGMIREAAHKNSTYKGYKFGYTKFLNSEERQSTIENPEREQVEYIPGENPGLEAPSMDFHEDIVKEFCI